MGEEELVRRIRQQSCAALGPDAPLPGIRWSDGGTRAFV